MQVFFDIETPMRDGVRLRGDAWVHEGARPVVLFRTAGDKGTLAHDFLLPTQCARAGYAVLVQDIRGRFRSEGQLTFSMRQEADDGCDTIAWLVAQPWCDGRVAMVGGSHAGSIQLATAMAGPAGLAAISPAMPRLPEHDREVFGGAALFAAKIGPLAHFAFDWTVRAREADVLDAGAAQRLREAALHWPTLLERVPSGRALEPLAPFLDALPRVPGPPTPFRGEALTVPSLFVTGWFDFCAGGTLRAFADACRDSPPAVRDAHRLVVGPWIHDLRTTHFAGALLFGVDAGFERCGLREAQLAFFDHHLRGAPAPSGPRVRYYMIGAGWRDSDAWPPSSERQRWHLASAGGAATAAGDGRLVREDPPADAPPDRFDYDPANAVRSHGGYTFSPAAPGPLDQRHLEARADVLCYTSAALTAPLELAGPISVELWASTSAVDTDFAARLVEVHPDGRAILMCHGVRRARFRRGATPVPVEPGAVERYEIPLGDLAWRIPAGHRLRLHLTSSDFPHVDRNLNTGGAMGAESQGVVAHQTIFHDAAHPSVLSLPVCA